LKKDKQKNTGIPLSRKSE